MEKIIGTSSCWYEDGDDRGHNRASSLLDQFERLSIEIQLNRAMLQLGRCSSESILTTRCSSNSIVQMHQLQLQSPQLPSSTKILDHAAEAAGSTTHQQRSGLTKVILQKLLRLPLILGWKRKKSTKGSGPAPTRRRSSREIGGGDQAKAKEEEAVVLPSSFLYFKALSRSLRV